MRGSKLSTSLMRAAFLVALNCFIALPMAAVDGAENIVPPSVQTVTGIPDFERSVSKIISSAEGGEITTTAADGTVYRLTFPPNSLVWDDEITLTPWMAGFGFDGAPVIGFDVGPSGTQLAIPATVIIEPRGNALEGANLKDVTFFEGESSGETVARIAYPATGSFGLRLFHFSVGGGVGSGAAIPFTGGDVIRAYFYTDGSGVNPDFVSRETRSGVSTEQVIGLIEDWQRTIVQDRDAGRMDPIKAEGTLETTRRLMSEAQTLLEAKAVSKAAEKAEEIANRGDLAEYDDLIAQIAKMLGAERQDQLLGKEGNLKDNAIADLFDRFTTLALAQCESNPALVTSIVKIGRQVAMLGANDKTEANLQKLVECRPKKSLDEAIEGCFKTGDYGEMMIVYDWLIHDPNNGKLKPATVVAAYRDKVLAALNACARFEISIEVNSSLELTSVAKLDPPQDGEPPSVHTLSWIWSATTTVAYDPAYDSGSALNPVPVLLGSVVGESRSCTCAVRQPGAWVHSCQIKACTDRNDVPEDERFLELRDLTFVGGQPRRLSFNGNALTRFDVTTCYDGKCDTGANDLATLLACTTKVNVEMEASLAPDTWRGKGKCSSAIVPDLDWQTDDFSFTLRHTGKSSGQSPGSSL